MSNQRTKWHKVHTDGSDSGHVVEILDEALGMGFHFKLDNHVLYYTEDPLEQDFDAEEITIKIYKTH